MSFDGSMDPLNAFSSITSLTPSLCFLSASRNTFNIPLSPESPTSLPKKTGLLSEALLVTFRDSSLLWRSLCRIRSTPTPRPRGVNHSSHPTFHCRGFHREWRRNSSSRAQRRRSRSLRARASDQEDHLPPPCQFPTQYFPLQQCQYQRRYWPS